LTLRWAAIAAAVAPVCQPERVALATINRGERSATKPQANPASVGPIGANEPATIKRDGPGIHAGVRSAWLTPSR